MKESPARKPFKTRLLASLFIWLLIGVALAFIGLIIWLIPGRDEYQMRGANLPPLSELVTTEGKLVESGHRFSGGGRNAYSAAKIEFQTGGQTFQFRTLDGYGPNALPFKPGQTVEVLYSRGEPEKAWLKWEYDQIMDHYTGFSKGLMAEKMRGFYLSCALVMMLISGLFFLINLFFPLLGRFR
jgi:hypothetical protein